ncbi:MAG TPA: prohibitin family protein [Armatimonadota bacterium]|nr:prohibitin family protein [Armatimonadota bacterium]
MTLTSRTGAAKKSGLIAIVAILVVAWFVFTACTVVIDAGSRGVVFSKASGFREQVLDEGIHFVVPVLWEIYPYDVRSQTYTLGSKVLDPDAEIDGGLAVDALSSDGQTVTLHVSMRFHLDPEKVMQIHQDLGETYVTKIIKPQVRSSVRDEANRYPSVNIYSEDRQELQDAIQKELTKELAKNHIIVEEVLLRNVIFSSQFQDAIEQKQVAQQEALRMDYVVRKQEQEKLKTIILATGEAKATELKGQALASYPELVQWEYVHNLPEDVDVIVTDTRTIINLGDLFGRGEQ